MSESTQHKLSRIRPPRVQITYDVEIGDAIEMKELPLVVGILADLSGKPEEPLPYVKDRKFVEIDRDNFNEVLKSSAPRLAFKVPNRLSEEDNGGFLSVELKFEKIDDFHPGKVIQQIPALNKLYEARQRLVDLMAKLDGNDDLDALLQQVASNTDQQQELAEATKKEEGSEEAAAEEGGKK